MEPQVQDAVSETHKLHAALDKIKLVDRIIALRAKLPTRTRKYPKQSSSCYILHLPKDLFLVIVDYLPAEARAIASLTCSAFRNILRLLSPTRFSPQQYMLYLYALSRPFPSIYVCDVCRRYHRVSDHDTPFMPFPLLNQDCNKGVRDACTSRPLWPEHHHMQLTLKYSRLQKEKNLKPMHSSYLEALLMPYHGIQIKSMIPGITTTITCWAMPKVVKGKYLMKYIWQYENASSSDTADPGRPFTSAGLTVCQHQMIPSFHDFENWIRRARRQRRGWKLNYPRTIRFRPYELDNAAHKAYIGDEEGPEVVGSCPHCPTDFAVQIIGGFARATAWYDLGAEGSHWEPEWRVHDFGRDYRGPWALGHVHVRPQTIRRRYEEDVGRDTAK